MPEEAGAPAEPEWLREADTLAEEQRGEAEPVDPQVLAAARQARVDRLLGGLNPEQARAVTTTHGAVLILAGAGSGKTRVLAHRIAYLVAGREVPPWRILAVTFTNRAAGELRERIISLIGDRGRDVGAGTFHALCARVLRADGAAIGIDRRFVIYDTDDQQQLLKQILREEGLDARGDTRPAAILGAISRAKNEMLDPGELPPLRLATGRLVETARLARRYQEGLRRANALDFDDLLLEAVRLFREAPTVLERYRQRWRYLHVDEYQDTNRPQYLWIRALAEGHGNLCVVGDDDQSIYGWRGADLRNILDFQRDWPNATVVKLEQNYRSTQLILDAAHSVVSKNVARTDKKLWTRNPRGQEISRFEAYNEEEEAEWIVRRVEELTGGSSSILTRRADAPSAYRLRDIAVLYRTNAQSRAIEEACLRAGLRYQLVGGTRFYSRKEVKDALAYLRVLRSDADSVSFERIINVPARSIGDRTLEQLRAAAAERDLSTWASIELAARGDVAGIAPRAQGALAGFADLIRRLRSRIGVLPLPELLDDVLEASGYRAMLADGTEEGEERWANLLELREVTTRYDDLAPDDALDRLLEETALVADQDAYESDADALSLITLHAAKGLEFPVVFVAGLEEGLFPTSRAIDAEAGFNPDPRPMEEERRLAYVGMTRAKDRLYLSHAWRRATRAGAGFAAEPSRFLLEIPGELMVGPRLDGPADDAGSVDLDLVFGARRSSRFGTPIRAGGGAWRQGSGRPGAPGTGEPFRPTRDLAARRSAFAAGARSGELPGQGAPWDDDGPDPATWATARMTEIRRRAGVGEAGGGPAPGVEAGDGAPARPGRATSRPPRPVIPGERTFRDGDRVRHAKWGDGIVVTSRLTRADEEITVAFRDAQVGRKTLLASLANLEILG
jgi:DNA helicase-2/ATP-dependent DNA helicase PcrA